MDTCKLCNKERELRNSHIVPEFFYKEIYDEKHRIFPRKEGRKYGQMQKGYREPLLCGELSLSSDSNPYPRSSVKPSRA